MIAIDSLIELIDQKADLQHGQWTEWLDSKGVAHSTAQTLIQISEKFSKTPHGGFMGYKVLQLLSQDSTPESARTEAIEKAENGKKLKQFILAVHLRQIYTLSNESQSISFVFQRN